MQVGATFIMADDLQEMRRFYTLVFGHEPLDSDGTEYCYSKEKVTLRATDARFKEPTTRLILQYVVDDVFELYARLNTDLLDMNIDCQSPQNYNNGYLSFMTHDPNNNILVFIDKNYHLSINTDDYGEYYT